MIIIHLSYLTVLYSNPFSSNNCSLSKNAKLQLHAKNYACSQTQEPTELLLPVGPLLDR